MNKLNAINVMFNNIVGNAGDSQPLNAGREQSEEKRKGYNKDDTKIIEENEEKSRLGLVCEGFKIFLNHCRVHGST